MINTISSVPFMGYTIFNGDLNQISFTKKTLINTINQYSFCIAEEDMEFKTALQESDILLPDGMAVVAAVRWLRRKKIAKIAGATIHQHLLAELNQKGGRCFYLGSSEDTLTKIKDRMAIEFPNIRSASYSPPYQPQFSTTDNSIMVAAVNAFKPDVLFVGMTAPKQEKWAFAHKGQLAAPIICTIGAVFDFYAGTVARPSPFWVKIHLEWLIRLLKEPKRMWKRYLYYGPIFVKRMIQVKWNSLAEEQS